ncbi:MAG: hydrolase, partial [Melioribacteraceae bacterium]|nr:hydrolase [Melioribacteraceae bacterium]
MINQTKIKQLNIGDDVDHFLLVNKYDFKTTKAGKEFLDLMLSDDSGIINAKIWDGFEPLKPKLKNGMVLKIKGVVTEFMGAPQIKTSTFRISVENDGVS